MHISYKCDYALKVLLHLSLNSGNGVQTSYVMAKQLDIPIKFLEHVLAELKKYGYIKSKRGNVGGYFLSTPANKTIIGDVVRKIEGYIEPIACVENNYKGCKDLNSCAFRPFWIKVDKAISHIMDKTTLEDIVNESKVLKGTMYYQI